MKPNFLTLFFIQHWPALGKYKRYAVALKAVLSKRKTTYAQHHEDTILLELLRDLGSHSSIDYVDIGANHPTDISNSYLLYRHGYSGLLIDANPELCQLLRTFRPRDSVINIGVGKDASVSPFYISRTPVGSSFDKSFFDERDQSLDRIQYIPVISLDQAFSGIEASSIGVLSIDVEGWNLRVVEGASSVIAKSHILCIEYDTPHDRQSIISLLPGFQLIHDNNCNLIMQRK